MKNLLLTLVISFISLSAMAQVAEQVKIAEIMVKEDGVSYDLTEVVFNLPDTKTLTIGTYPDTKPREVVIETSATDVRLEYISSKILEGTYHRIVYRVNGISDVKYLVIHKRLSRNGIDRVIFFNKEDYEDTAPSYTRTLDFKNAPFGIIENTSGTINVWAYYGNVKKIKTEFTLKSKNGSEIKGTKL